MEKEIPMGKTFPMEKRISMEDCRSDTGQTCHYDIFCGMAAVFCCHAGA